MEAYRYQEIAYLIIPVFTGIEFFLLARDEKKSGLSSAGIYFLEFMGFIFIALIPGLFIFTITATEYKLFPLQTESLARFDRYGVMFLFFGAWWQVYLFGALRARRLRIKERPSKWSLWIPFLILGFYISLMILWVSPWGLKWISLLWFLLISLCLSRASLKTTEKVLWVLGGVTFVAENILFIWLESIV